MSAEPWDRLQQLIVRLDRRISDMERAFATTPPREVAAASDEEAGPVRDAAWNCSKCGSRLAFYDSAEDVLRIRYKEHMSYVHLGEGGWVQIVCKGCGEPNVQAYVTPEEAAETRQAERLAAKVGRKAVAPVG